MTNNNRGSRRRGHRGQSSKEARDVERLESRQHHVQCPVCGENDMYWMGTCQNCMMSEEPIKIVK